VRDAEGLGDARAKLPIFLGTVTIMLLIAAANAAGILLSRFAARQSELVIRSALGASMGRLVRQLITESVLLSLMAGGVAIGVAAWTVDLVLSYRPFYIPFALKTTIDWSTFACILALSLAVGAIFGFLPAIASARGNLHETMNQTSGRVGGHSWRDRTRNIFLIAEIALSVGLLAGAALMVNTVLRISHINIGFDPKGLAMSRINLDSSRYRSEVNWREFYDTLLARLSGEPEVRAVTLASHLCEYDPQGGCGGNPVRILGRTDEEAPVTPVTVVTPGFFSAMGMRMLRGHEFSAREGVPAIIVDQTFVDEFLPHEDPIGKQVELLHSTMNHQGDVKAGVRTIVGVTAPVRRVAYWAKPFPEAYVPFDQNPVASIFVVVRTADSDSNVIRRTVAGLDDELPVYFSDTMSGWIDKFYAAQHFELLILSVFSGLALLISVSGLYAVISHRVRERTRELGIRLALGASRRDVQWLVLRQAAILILTGTLTGIFAAGILGQMLSKLIFGVQPRDPVTLAAASGLVLLVSFLSAYAPAKKAAGMDPLVALRHE
jgi:putative ABC transport system permease protein